MNSDQKKIGIFDSGIGGFSILKELVNLLKGHQFFYISDRPYAPYGNKTADFIAERCEILTKELLKQEVDIVVVACNTATAEGIDFLRQSFDIPFVGIEPFVKVIESFKFIEDVKPVVLTTKAMNESKRFRSLLSKYDPEGKIHPHACPNLASLVEKAFDSNLDSVKSDIYNELSELKEKSYTHAILGCTHYPLVSKLIADYLELTCLSPCLPVAKRVAHLLQVESINKRTELYFKTSDQEIFSSLDPGVLSLE